MVLRDLKHLIFFEDLLQDANNALVQAACAEGRHALAYNCSYIPEVLLDVEGCFSVRLRAPRCTNPDLATYYMTNRSCPYSKSILERAFEGGYNFIDALLGQECCTTMNRMEQYFDYCKLIPKEKFFTSFIDMPLKKTAWHAGYFRRQIEQKIIEPLGRVYGVDFSEEKLRAAIEQHNEVCRIITEIGDMRKLPNPPITGYEFHVIQLVSLTCPKDLILPYLRETLEEIKSREPEPKFPFRARVMVAGSEIDDPDFTKLLEGCGAYVVADRYCFGSIPGREEIIVKPDEDILQAIADHYIQTNQCPRAMGPENVVARKQFLYKIAQEYGAEGVIVENMKFCEYWGYERAQAAQWMRDGFSLPGTLPVCQIEKDYTNAATGQLRTRFQAFVESLEIKRIQSEK
jgi:benzoyl-CoA reductase/2-hydroxyglutaryl-CoA dehydratase subunit BcrC/BadD/HgdB